MGDWGSDDDFGEQATAVPSGEDDMGDSQGPWKTPEERLAARAAREAHREARVQWQATDRANAEAAVQQQQLREEQDQAAAQAIAHGAKAERKKQRRHAGKAQRLQEGADAEEIAARAAEDAAVLASAAAAAAASAPSAAGAAHRAVGCWADALEGQLLHLGVLVPGAAVALWCAPAAEAVAPPYTRCVVATVLHQCGATLLWRAELHGGSRVTLLCRGNRYVAARLTALFDTTSFGMALRAFVSVALADRNSLFTPGWGHLLVAGLLGALATYALGSALLLLGPMAISGSDHFLAPGAEPGPKLVRAGAYGLCDHPLFFVGLLLLWAVAIACGSQVALALALFLHAAALAFLFGTEVPDMRRIYGRPPSRTKRSSSKAG